MSHVSLCICCTGQPLCLHFDNWFFYFVVNSETTVKQNGGPISLNLAKETTEPDSEIVESDCKPTDAPVISDIPVTTVQEVVEEVMKSKEVKVHLFGKMFKKKAERSADVKSVQEKTTSNEDQTDVSLPATDPQPVSAPYVFIFKI